MVTFTFEPVGVLSPSSDFEHPARPITAKTAAIKTHSNFFIKILLYKNIYLIIPQFYNIDKYSFYGII